MLKIRTDIYGNLATMFLEGRIDVTNSEKLKEELEILKNKGVKKIYIDMTNLEYIDSSGLGRILYFYMDYKKLGGKIEIHNVKNETIKKVIELVKLNKIIKVRDYPLEKIESPFEEDLKDIRGEDVDKYELNPFAEDLKDIRGED